MEIGSNGETPIEVRCSKGAKRRAAQLGRWLNDLHRVAAPELHPEGRTELWVLAVDDWRRVARHPYGAPFTRTRGGRGRGGHDRPADGATVVAAAHYPGRLLRRFDPVRLRAAQRGLEAPGDVRERLDLMLGHEWGHAFANTAGIRTRVRWLDEFLATYLLLVALETAGLGDLRQRFEAWARFERVGAEPDRRDLGAFDRRRVPFETGLWFQGVLTARAAAVLEHGWELPRAIRAALPAGSGDATRALLAYDPSFRDWFASFGNAPGDASGAASTVSDV